MKEINDENNNRTGSVYPALNTFENVETVIEIGEIMNSQKLFLHMNDIPESSEENVNSMEKGIRNTMIQNTDYLESSKSGYPLPPGSVQSFKKAKRDINALLLTDFNEDFKTDFYASRFDQNSDSNKITPDFSAKLANSASGLAKGILKQSTNMVNAELTSVSVPSSRVLKLADCFQGNNTCEDFLRALPLNAFVRFKNVTQMLADPTAQRMFEKLNNRYVGTLGSADAIYQNMFKNMQSNSVITVFVLHLLVKILGEKKGEINVNNYSAFKILSVAFTTLVAFTKKSPFFIQGIFHL